MFDKEKSPVRESPPDLIPLLTGIIKNTRRKPKMFPADPVEAAKFWISHQEPPHEFVEAIEKITQGDKTFWKTPYYDRLAGNLRKFLTLSHLHQLYVIENVEKGIPWRGDDPKMYTNIVGEELKMQENPESYIDDALNQLKNFKMRQL